MNKNYCVYVHVNKIDYKKYFGLTSMKPQDRWRNGYGYLGKNKDGSYCHPHFANAILKYSWDNFEHIIIATGLTKEEAEQMEIELIAKYKTTDRNFGYNIQNGGSSIGKLAEESKIKISKSLKEYYAKNGVPTKGRHCTDDEKMYNMMNQPTRKDVICYDINSNCVVGVYNSVNEAARETSASLSAVSACCNGKFNSVHGLKFQFVSEPHEFVPSDYIDKKKKRVKQIDVDTGEVIAIYGSVKEAYKATGINNISAVARCNTKHKTAGGYKWEYA